MSDEGTPTEVAAQQRPPLRVVRGDASPEEVAALTAVLAARARTARASWDAAAGCEQPASRWADRSEQVRRPLPRGRDAWRAAVR